jgi:2-isopropylmalate synthase
MGIANAFAALIAGATCVHATALGIGERVGNTQMDQMLVNLRLMGIEPWEKQDLTRLKEYCEKVSQATGVPIPRNYPVIGDDAYRTATGVHAAAIIKAFHKNDVELANNVYSGVPAHYFGLEQIIEIGPMSGRSNVVYWLQKRGIPAENGTVERILVRAKNSDRVLTETEILDCCRIPTAGSSS